MALLFGTLRGRKALAWLKHRRWWQWNRTGPGGSSDTRITTALDRRVTSDGAVRVVRPGTVVDFTRYEEDGVTQRLQEDGIVRIEEAAA